MKQRHRSALQTLPVTVRGKGSQFQAINIYLMKDGPDRPTLKSSSGHFLVHTHSSTNQLPELCFVDHNWRCHMDF